MNLQHTQSAITLCNSTLTFFNESALRMNSLPPPDFQGD